MTLVAGDRAGRGDAAAADSLLRGTRLSGLPNTPEQAVDLAPEAEGPGIEAILERCLAEANRY